MRNEPDPLSDWINLLSASNRLILPKYHLKTQTRPALHYICRKLSYHHLVKFSNIELFTIDKVFGGWKAAQSKFFADGGIFDQIYQPR